MHSLIKAASDQSLSRRTFLRVSGTAAGGLLVGLHIDLRSLAHQRQQGTPKVYPPDAFVHVMSDGRLLITVNRIELGQGVATALPMILADEMDADWSRVVAELAPAGDIYKDPIYGFQNTGGSATVANSWQQYRELGAKTRAMLVAAAAARWNVPPAQCRTANSIVYGPANQSASYAELAADAAKLPVPEKVRLKEPSEFRIIGKRIRRLDGRAKSVGAQRFGLDLDLPGMVTAVVARPPVFGGRVKAIDDREARGMPGVLDVFEIPLLHGSAVATVADRFWTAKRARDRLKIDWDISGVERADSIELWNNYRVLARTPGNVAVSRGDEKAMDRIPAENRVVGEYELPYVAHTAMEPLNATIRVDGDRAEAWVPSQIPQIDQAAIAQVLGLKPENVNFHVEFAGGGFGRRQVFDSHVQRQAAEIAKRVRGRPVKLIWSREDDVQGGYYRPMYLHRVEAGVGQNGMPVAWRHVVVGQSVISGTPFESALVKNGVDFDAVGGTADTPYAIPNFHVSAHHPTVNVPPAQWRSVGHSHNIFVMESMIDELAVRVRMDPIAYRLKLLKPDALRLRAALALLEQKIEWRRNLPRNHAVGIACIDYQGTAVACAAEATIDGNRVRVPRVMMAVHCGLAVNPLTIESQFQGGVLFGMTQLLPKGAITVKDGRVEQRNFHDFVPPYISDAPVTIDVHIVPSTEAPTGIGEPPVPVISPAVTNALARLTGKRYRSLPLVSL